MERSTHVRETISRLRWLRTRWRGRAGGVGAGDGEAETGGAGPPTTESAGGISLSALPRRTMLLDVVCRQLIRSRGVGLAISSSGENSLKACQVRDFVHLSIQAPQLVERIQALGPHAVIVH
jgi:hypothetical protein